MTSGRHFEEPAPIHVNQEYCSKGKCSITCIQEQAAIVIQLQYVMAGYPESANHMSRSSVMLLICIRMLDLVSLLNSLGAKTRLQNAVISLIDGFEPIFMNRLGTV